MTDFPETILDKIDQPKSIDQNPVPISKRKCYAMDNYGQTCKLANKCAHFWMPIDIRYPGYWSQMMPPTPFNPDTGCREYIDIGDLPKEHLELDHIAPPTEDKSILEAANVFEKIRKTEEEAKMADIVKKRRGF